MTTTTTTATAPTKKKAVSFTARTDGRYRYTPELELAVRVALATDRVLLVTGPPGTGKSTLAYDIAETLGFAPYSMVVTSQTESRDFRYSFDHVARLNDAYSIAVEQATKVEKRERYLQPGVLWWAFNPESAATRFGAGVEELTDPSGKPKASGAVVLIDEIDKADPDVPNDLLVPIDQKTFPVEPINNREVTRARDHILLVVTSNGERELPQAFLRRCVRARLTRPDVDTPEGAEFLRGIAKRRFADQAKERDAALDPVIEAYRELSKLAKAQNTREPATAEFLDALTAAIELQKVHEGIDVKKIIEVALWKHSEPPKKPAETATAEQK